MSFERVTQGITGGTDATKLVHTRDFATTTFEAQLTDNEAVGRILEYGTGTTVAGELYYIRSTAGWVVANATATNSGDVQQLAVALGTSPTADGMLIDGWVRVDTLLVNGTAVIGAAVYMSTTAGEYTFTAPSASGNAVRIVGYCADIDSGDILLHFAPSPESMTIA